MQSADPIRRAPDRGLSEDTSRSVGQSNSNRDEEDGTEAVVTHDLKAHQLSEMDRSG